MQDSERIKLEAFHSKRISIGITKGGVQRNSGPIPWESTAHAFNMRTPNIYFEESDFHDPVILTRLEELEVIGCYIFTPLEDYSFLARFIHLEDLYITKGHNVHDLSFTRNMTEWFMFYLEDADLDNLDDLFLQPNRRSKLHSYCFGLTNCRVKDISAIAKAKDSIRLSELIICGEDSKLEKERWRALPALKHKYYTIKH